MKRDFLYTIVFLVIAAAVFYGFFALLAPFFVPLAWATVFAILFYPMYVRLKRRFRSGNIASGVSVLIVALLILGPFGWLGTMVVIQATEAIQRVNELYRSGELAELLSPNVSWLEGIWNQIGQWVDLQQLNLEELARQGIDRIGSIIVEQSGWVVSNAVTSVFYFAIILFTLFYFFRDGRVLVNRVKRLIPLAPEQVATTFRKLQDVINATMYGGVLIALFQGFLGGLMFWIVGLPSPIFWGAVMAILSIIPFIGAFLVYVPAGIILIITGSVWQGILVIAIGTVVISQSDNVLRPYLVSGRTQMHPGLLFFAIMGGIGLFGLLGLVVGPLIAAVTLTMVNVIELKLNEERGFPAIIDDPHAPTES